MGQVSEYSIITCDLKFICTPLTAVHTLSEPLKLSRMFQMRNTGPTALTIMMIGVGGGGCGEHGFSVDSCDAQFTIQPNKTKKVEIS